MGNDLRECIRSAASLAFSHACTGPSEEYQKTGSHYVIKDLTSGEVVFSIAVTEDGNKAMSDSVDDLIAKDKEAIRSLWAYDTYTRENNSRMVGDVSAVTKLIADRLPIGHHVFDGLQKVSGDIFLKPKIGKDDILEKEIHSPEESCGPDF
jgi:hypothetical protein